MDGSMVPIAICVILPVLIIITVYLFNYLGKRSRLKTIEKAMDKGIELSPDILNEAKEPKKKNPNNPMSKFTISMILIGLGIALFIMLYLLVSNGGEKAEFAWGVASIGLIPFLIGVGILISFFVERRYNEIDKKYNNKSIE